MLVLDASVAAAWIFPDEVSEYSERVLDHLKSSRAIVPSIWPLEVANVLAMGERRGRLTDAQVEKAISDLGHLPVRVAGSIVIGDTGSLLALARLGQVTAYDASYLDLARREHLPLATLDERLRAAALKLDVRLFQ